MCAFVASAGGTAIAWAVSRGWTAEAVLVVAAVSALALVAAAGLTYYIRAVHHPDDYAIEDLTGELTVRRTIRTEDRFLYRYDYVRTQRVRATRHHLRLVCIRSHWSGQSITVSEVASCCADHVLFDGGVAEEDGRIYRWLYLLGPIGRGRRVTVGIRQSFEDAFVPMKPYYRESGEDRRVDRMTVRLRFPTDEVPDRVWLVTWKRTRKGFGRQEVAREACGPARRDDAGMVVFEAQIARPHRSCAHGFVWRPPVPAAPAAVPVGEAASVARGRPGLRKWRP